MQGGRLLLARRALRAVGRLARLKSSQRSQVARGPAVPARNGKSPGSMSELGAVEVWGLAASPARGYAALRSRRSSRFFTVVGCQRPRLAVR